MLQTLKKRGISVKLNTVVIATLATLLIATMVVTYLNIDSFTTESGKEQAAQELEMVQSRFMAAEQNLLASTRLLAATPGLREVMAEKDTPLVRMVTRRRAGQLDMDRVDVVYADGSRLPKDSGADPLNIESGWEALATLGLLGIEATGLVIEQGSVNEEILMAASLPVRDTSGVIVGALLAARKIDDEFIKEVNLSRENVNLAIVRNGQILAQHAQTGELVSAAVPDEISVQRVLNGQSVIVEDLVSSQHGTYSLAYLPLTAGGGDAQAVTVVLREAGGLFVLQRRLITNMAITFSVLALVAVVVISLFAKRYITEPIGKLRDLADKVSLGDLNAEVTINSKDEIGDLANSFGRMVVAVRFLSAEEEQG